MTTEQYMKIKLRNVWWPNANIARLSMGYGITLREFIVQTAKRTASEPMSRRHRGEAR